MNRKQVVWVLVLTMIVAVGCAKVPQMEVDAADQSLERARSAEAAEYASAAMTEAENARRQLDAELKAQEERFALVRSYDKAKELAATAKAAGERAEKSAVEARNKAREEAAQLIAEVRSTLVEVKTMLDTAPRGKGTEVDIAMLKSDLAAVEASLPEIDGAFTAERYLDAKAKAMAAKDSAGRVRSEIEHAIEASKAPARRG